MKFKKVLSIIMAVCTLIVSISMINVNAATTKYYGDADGDGLVSISDVTKIQMYLVGLSNLSSEQMKLADVDKDGRANIQDATAIQKYLAGYTSGVAYVGKKYSQQTSTATQPTTQAPTQPATSAVDANGGYYCYDMANRVMEMMNENRAAEGLQPLRVGASLENTAEVRVKEITQRFGHSRPDGTSYTTAFDKVNYRWYACAENIADGHISPEDVMRAWMMSRGHNANIMDEEFTHFSVATYCYKGRLYWCAVFGQVWE